MVIYCYVRITQTLSSFNNKHLLFHRRSGTRFSFARSLWLRDIHEAGVKLSAGLWPYLKAVPGTSPQACSSSSWGLSTGGLVTRQLASHRKSNREALRRKHPRWRPQSRVTSHGGSIWSLLPTSAHSVPWKQVSRFCPYSRERITHICVCQQGGSLQMDHRFFFPTLSPYFLTCLFWTCIICVISKNVKVNKN